MKGLDFAAAGQSAPQVDEESEDEESEESESSEESEESESESDEDDDEEEESESELEVEQVKPPVAETKVERKSVETPVHTKAAPTAIDPAQASGTVSPRLNYPRTETLTRPRTSRLRPIGHHCRHRCPHYRSPWSHLRRSDLPVCETRPKHCWKTCHHFLEQGLPPTRLSSLRFCPRVRIRTSYPPSCYWSEKAQYTLSRN